jgi:dTDP-4-amino-4,6-dideoxygalactose transaminase
MMADKNNKRLELPVWPKYEQDEIKAVVNILRSGKGNTWVGQDVKSFENEFSEYIGMPYGVAVCNGTVSLELALYSLGIGDGDDVIVPAKSFIATASCVVIRGARPVFADVDLKSQNITLDTIKDVITKDTRAIIVVHLGGWPCEMDAISKYTRQNNIKLIEDCAQAHGAKYNDQYVGSFGDASSFSFCHDKIISTGGEGGLLLLRDKKVWERAWSYKDHGKDYNAVFNEKRENGFAWVHNTIGTNWRLTEMQASIGRVQLRKLKEWVDKRRRNAQILVDGIKNIKCVEIFTPQVHEQHAYYRFYLFIKEAYLKEGWNRNRVIETFNKKGVPCFQGGCSEIYRENAFLDENYQPEKRLNNAEILDRESLCFLVHHTLTENDMNYMLLIIVDVFASAQK